MFFWNSKGKGVEGLGSLHWKSKGPESNNDWNSEAWGIFQRGRTKEWKHEQTDDSADDCRKQGTWQALIDHRQPTMFVHKSTQNMHQRYIFIEKLLSVMTSVPRNIIRNVEGKLGRICNIVKKLTHIVYILFLVFCRKSLSSSESSIYYNCKKEELF